MGTRRHCIAQFEYNGEGVAIAATTAQINQYAEHKGVCQDLGIPQSTLRHRNLMGTISPPSVTGVTTYTGPGPRTTRPTTTDTLVWAVWKALIARGQDSPPETGRQSLQRVVGQCPAIDDNQNLITIAHDDGLVDGGGTEYRVMSPVLETDVGFWTFGLVERK